MNRTQVNNVAPKTHNWLVTATQSPHGGAVAPINTSKRVQDVAGLADADFGITYYDSGYFNEATMDFEVPTYDRGDFKGQAKDQYIERTDTQQMLGNHSGKYPDREGYNHVFNTLEELFPESCESVTVYGHGERLVVEQVLDDPIDLGGGDTIQPFIYTRMSLNGTWKTEVIPIQRRISCENMLGHKGSIVGVKATRNHDNILTMRSDVLEQSMYQARELALFAEELSMYDADRAMFQRMLDEIIPLPEEDASSRLQTSIARKRGSVVNAWNEEMSRFGTQKWGMPTGSLWLAFNAFQGAEQHRINQGYKSTEESSQKALAKSLDGKTPIADAAEQYLRELVSI